MNDGGYTTPVNQYPGGKSLFGVYDMSGNVWEWTSSQIVATNGAERGQKVYAIKGGSWYANMNSCKINMRVEGRRPNIGYNTVGIYNRRFVVICISICIYTGIIEFIYFDTRIYNIAILFTFNNNLVHYNPLILINI